MSCCQFGGWWLLFAAVSTFACCVIFVGFVFFYLDKLEAVADAESFKPHKYFILLELLVKVCTALVISSIGTWHRKLASIGIIVLNLAMCGLIAVLPPYHRRTAGVMTAVMFNTTLATAVTYVCTLVAVMIDDPTSTLPAWLFVRLTCGVVVVFVGSLILVHTRWYKGPEEGIPPGRADKAQQQPMMVPMGMMAQTTAIPMQQQPMMAPMGMMAQTTAIPMQQPMMQQPMMAPFTARPMAVQGGRP